MVAQSSLAIRWAKTAKAHTQQVNQMYMDSAEEALTLVAQLQSKGVAYIWEEYRDGQVITSKRIVGEYRCSKRS